MLHSIFSLQTTITGNILLVIKQMASGTVVAVGEAAGRGAGVRMAEWLGRWTSAVTAVTTTWAAAAAAVVARSQ